MGHETSKCQAKRLKRGDFKRYLTGYGIDIGSGNDPLQVIEGTVDHWDLPQGDAQKLAGLENEKYDFRFPSFSNRWRSWKMAVLSGCAILLRRKVQG